MPNAKTCAIFPSKRFVVIVVTALLSLLGYSLGEAQGVSRLATSSTWDYHSLKCTWAEACEALLDDTVLYYSKVEFPFEAKLDRYERLTPKMVQSMLGELNVTEAEAKAVLNNIDPNGKGLRPIMDDDPMPYGLRKSPFGPPRIRIPFGETVPYKEYPDEKVRDSATFVSAGFAVATLVSEQPRKIEVRASERFEANSFVLKVKSREKINGDKETVRWYSLFEKWKGRWYTNAFAGLLRMGVGESDTYRSFWRPHVDSPLQGREAWEFLQNIKPSNLKSLGAVLHMSLHIGEHKYWEHFLQVPPKPIPTEDYHAGSTIDDDDLLNECFADTFHKHCQSEEEQKFARIIFRRHAFSSLPEDWKLVTEGGEYMEEKLLKLRKVAAAAGGYRGCLKPETLTKTALETFAREELNRLRQELKELK